MIRIIFVIYLFIHGVSHLVGFVIPWRLMEMEDMPYKTKIFRDLIDVGDTGIRILGIVWLLLACAFFCSGILLLSDVSYWKSFTIVVTILSLIFCIVSFPDAKIGILANIIIFGFLFLNDKFMWLS